MQTTTEEQTKRLREMAEEELQDAAEWYNQAGQEIPQRKLSSPEQCREMGDKSLGRAAALLAGAAALDAVQHLQRFAEAMADDKTPVLMGFAYQIQTIIDKHAKPEVPHGR